MQPGCDRSIVGVKKVLEGKKVVCPRSPSVGMDGDCWCDLVAQFGKLFKRAAGTADSLAKEAARRGQRYVHAPGLKLMPTCEA